MPRFTIRTIMVAVALIAVPLGMCAERTSRFIRLADWNDVRAGDLQVHNECCGSFALYIDAKNGRILEPAEGRRREILWEWHRDIAEKYRAAARYPWLPVEPDPPKPQ